MLVILSGVAGAGKDTIKKEIIKRMENVKSIPSFTSRPPREGDIPGKTYIFLTKEEFEKKIRNDEIYEYDIHHNNYYGTSKQILNEESKTGIIIKDIDVKGMINLRKYLNGKVKMISIFLDAPDELLEKRLVMRGERAERVKVRLSRGELERKYKDEFDLVVENIELKKTLKIIEDFIEYQRNL